MADTQHFNLYSLTHPQKRIWYHEKIYSGASLHNLGGSIIIKGRVNFEILQKAINIFIHRHEGMRLQFTESDGDVRQYVEEYKPQNIDFLDFSKWEEPELQFEKWVKEEAARPFPLEDGRLFYFALFNVGDCFTGYFVKFHHIISDGWSFSIMTEEIFSLYRELLDGKEVCKEAENSYLEYKDIEREYMESKRFIKDKAFWNERFKVLPEVFLRKSSENLEGKRSTFDVDLLTSEKIKRFVSDNNISINTFYVALFIVYLYKTTGHREIIIGSPVLNRSGKKEKSIFGMFTSTMPFRMKINSFLSIKQFFRDVNSEMLQCYFHQRYPYNILVEDLKLKEKGFDSLFQVCVNYYNTKLDNELDGIPVENIEFYNGSQTYSLQLVIKEWSDSGRITLQFDYKTKDYEEGQIKTMHTFLGNLVEQTLSNPQASINELSIIPRREENKILYEFNSTHREYPSDKTITVLFEEQAERTPEKTAVSCKGAQLTYRELNEKSNQLARYLMAKGLKKNRIAGIMTVHSIEAVLAILAVMKAGGTYMPVDPLCPENRVLYMLENANSPMLLTNCGVKEIPGFKGDILPIDNLDAYAGDVSNLSVESSPSDLAYVIYTSGSTGVPKGVMVEHRGLVNYIWWAKQMYIKSQEDIFALYSSLTFDLTVTSLFAPLVNGNEIEIYRDDMDEFVLYRIVKEKKCTVLKLTPAHLTLLKDLDNRDSAIRTIIVGGEDLKSSLAEKVHRSFNGNIDIYNEYGPTETVVGCTVHKYDFEKDREVSVPIGRPAHNVQIYILDRDRKPVPEGNIGEAFVSGDGVARGYINADNLTAQYFISNPFLKGKSMYKTGDLMRLDKAGNLVYMGRVDQQVKINGYRIEPGEIERHLMEYRNVKDAFVMGHGRNSGERILCAYVAAEDEVDEINLKSYLSDRLPAYMIPSYYCIMEKLPITQNGKIDRSLLPKPESGQESGGVFIAPRNEMEKKLTKVISQVLNIEKISIADNFFSLGGDSIKAIQIAARLNEEGLKIRVKDILSHSIIESMALHVENMADSIFEGSTMAEGEVKPLPIVSWFFSRKFSNLNYYHQSIMLQWKKEVEEDKLKAMFRFLIKHHDSLRINYNEKTGRLFYNNTHLNREFDIPAYNLSNSSRVEQENKIRQISEQIKAGMNIGEDLLIKACSFDLGERGKQLLITAHHLIVDGISWRIILEDINSILNQMYSGQTVCLPPKTRSMQDWAVAVEKYAGSEAQKEVGLWKAVLKNSYTYPAHWSKCRGGEEKVTGKISRVLGVNETEQLLYKANQAYNTYPNELLLIALALEVSEYDTGNEILIEIESHGRAEVSGDVDVSRTVGWFTSIYPVSLSVPEEEGIIFRIKSLKEQLRRTPNNGIGYGALRYISKQIDENERMYLRFNYMGDMEGVSDTDYFTLLQEGTGFDMGLDNKLTCAADLTAMIVNKQLAVDMTYNPEEFRQEIMENFLNKYIVKLKTLLEHCCNKAFREYTPSDFDGAELLQHEIDGLFE